MEEEKDDNSIESGEENSPEVVSATIEHQDDENGRGEMGGEQRGLGLATNVIWVGVGMR